MSFKSGSLVETGNDPGTTGCNWGHITTYSINSSFATGTRYYCGYDPNTNVRNRNINLDDIYEDKTSLYIPIKNVYGIISLKSPDQVLCMSDDSKYIFINKSFNPSQFESLYSEIYSIISNNIPIPLQSKLAKVNNYRGGRQINGYASIADEDKTWYN
jgi:hypothetical protein